MTAKSESLGLLRWAFWPALAFCLLALGDLRSQGYSSGDLTVYAGIMALFLFEYRR